MLRPKCPKVDIKSHLMYNFGMEILKGITFSVILQEEKLKNKTICPYLSSEMKKRGYDLTPRHIQRYKSGVCVPSLEIATEILQILNISYSDSDVKELLENSRKYKKEIEVDKTSKSLDINVGSRAESVNVNITINRSDLDFINEYIDDSLADIISPLKIWKDRVEEAYGHDKNSYKRYILDLIKKDMKGELR